MLRPLWLEMRFRERRAPIQMLELTTMLYLLLDCAWLNPDVPLEPLYMRSAMSLVLVPA